MRSYISAWPENTKTSENEESSDYTILNINKKKKIKME